MVRLPLRVALLALAACASAPEHEPQVVRVMTYNIHHGEGSDGRFDLQRLAQIIRDADPDLVALQEVDRNTARSGGVDQIAELSRLTGMHSAFGKALEPLIERSHEGNVQHVGKIAAGQSKSVTTRQALLRLQRELQQAVELEDYEKAARLRDEIQKAESS